MWVLGVTIHLYLIVAIGVYLVYPIHGMKSSSHICRPRMGFPPVNYRSSSCFFFSSIDLKLFGVGEDVSAGFLVSVFKKVL